MNKDNEAGLIGGIMADPSQYEAVSEIINKNDFSWQPYGWAWQAIKTLRENNMGIDVITVGDELERKQKLGEFMTDGEGVMMTGRAGLSQLRAIGEPGNVMSYAFNVKDYSAKRDLDDLFSQGAVWSQNGRNANDIKNDIIKRIEDVQTFSPKAISHTQSIADAVSLAYDETDRAANGKIDYIPTGFADLDRMFSGGMTAPDLLILAGRPGTGKTAMMSNIAINSAKKKKNIVFFSLEMANKQIARRMIAQESGVSYDAQKSGKLAEDEWPKFTHGIESVAALSISLNDLPSIKISQIRQELRRLDNIDLVIVDYLQLATADGHQDNRVLEVGAVSRGLKLLAKEFDVPFLVGAQLSRAVEQRQSKRPVLSDLRESGSIEQDADIVMFIHPDEIKKQTELIVAKHRNGPVGSVQLAYRPALTKFENMTYRSE